MSIATLTAYRPDYKRIASGKVSAAREKLGMTPAEYAEHLTARLEWDVPPQAVENWEGGSTPPGDVVLACADAAPVGADGDRDEVRPYAGRGLISREQWNGIITGTTGELWLYGMAEFGYATDDEVPAILADSVAAGCRVRVLLLNPDCPAAAAVDADEGSPPGTLPSRIRASLVRFEAMSRECPAIEIRTYDTHPTVSIVRGDGEMLVTPYLRYFLGSNSPTLALTASSAPGVFSRYERHFESMWNHNGGND